MKNAAMTPSAPAIDPRLGIEIVKANGETIRLNCGNFTYRESPVAEGGPIILTLLRLNDRNSEKNEPFMVLSRVMEFRVLDEPVPMTPSQPVAEDWIEAPEPPTMPMPGPDQD